MIGQGSRMRIDTFPAVSVDKLVGRKQDEDCSTPSSERQVPFATIPMGSWIYRGEGNANVVIALPHEQKVIRFRKLLSGEVSPDGGRRRACREAEFVRDVASSFLGSYVPSPEILRFSMRDVAKLSEAIRSLRPEKRRHKDIAEEYATKFPDYTFLPATLLQDRSSLRASSSTFCLEIKPKQGFVRAAERKFQKCPYCLTQYYKLKRKSIATRSSYCPLDLFSADEGRINTALKGLLRSPQNNLKIFKDGIVVYDQNSSSNDLERVLTEWFRNVPADNERKDENAFCTLVRATLLRPFPQDAQNSNLHRARASRLSRNQEPEIPTFDFIASDTVAKARKLLYFTREECNFEGKHLPSDSVLGRILRMQRLCGTDSETIYNIYSSYATFLDDDLIYADLKSLRDMYGEVIRCQTTPVPTKDAKAQNGSLVAEKRHLYTGRKHISYSEESCRDDPNGNEIANERNLDWVVGKDEIIESTNTKASLSAAYEHCQPAKFNDKINCERKSVTESESTLINIEHLMTLRNYLLFTTAKDCSILMAFHELKPDAISTVPEEYVIKISEDVHFLASVRVSDVDPKNIHCIQKHMQRDVDTLESVISTLEEELAIENSAT